MYDELLYHHILDANSVSDHLQLIILVTVHTEVLKELHDEVVGGHLGQDETLSCLKECFYWPGH